jgi:hypothetical protein
MKKTVLSTFAILALSTAIFAQQAELKSAQANLEKKNYIAAIDDLNKAKTVVTKLISDNLASVLPAKFGEFEMKDNDSGGGMGGVSVNRVYKKPAPAKPEPSGGIEEGGNRDMNQGMIDPKMMMGYQEQISVQITTNMSMAREVMNAHAMSEDGMGNGQSNVKPIRAKGYRAIIRTSGNEGDPMMGGSKMETAQAIVGGAFVSVEARGLKEVGQAEKLLNLIDFEKLKGIVGE